MSWIATEVVGRSGSAANTPQAHARRRYSAVWSGAPPHGSEADAIAAVAAVAPATLDVGLATSLYLQQIDYDQRIPAGYEFVAIYGPLTLNASTPPPRPTNSSFKRMSLGLEPVHLVTPLATTVFGADPKPEPKLIGDQNNDEPPEGCDWFEFSGELSEQHYLPKTWMTAAKEIALAGLLGTTNAATFRGFAADTCLMWQIDAAQRGIDDIELTFVWRYRPHLTDATILGVTGVNKKAWEFLWPYRRVAVESERISNNATHIVVNQLAASADWAAVLPSRGSGF
jgi:hypothetical protein